MTAPLLDLKNKIQKLDQIPAMPHMAAQIIRLKNNPNASVKELSMVIELDPSLAAQVIRYAQSPYFGYRGKVESVQTAISRVLGFEMVLHLAFGIATCKPFKLPRQGPLGLKAFWKHAVYAAALAQGVSALQTAENRPSAGLAYLAGLLHNFGFLVMGHLFQQEYALLTKYVNKYPTKPIIDIEQRLFGVHHGQIGAWLLSAWALPDEIVVAAQQHHHPQYSGNHEEYSQLIIVVNHVLKRYGLGDELSEEIPKATLDALGLGEYMVLHEAQKIVEKNQDLKKMVAQMLA